MTGWNSGCQKRGAVRMVLNKKLIIRAECSEKIFIFAKTNAGIKIWSNHK